MTAKRARVIAVAFVIPMLGQPAAAQTDTSSWTSDKIVTPAERSGGTKLLKTAPFQAPGQVRLPPTGKGGVVTTRAPVPGVPTLPSDVPVDGTTISKTGAGADPAYEAFDLGRYKSALELAKAAAERNEPQAATLIGRIYQEGLGVGRDDVEAAQWYRRGAELGDTNAMFAFGVMLADGGAIKRDHQGAAQMFEKAASKGHVIANYDLALLFLTGEGKPENPRRAFAHMQYAANAGLANAQYDLATLYATGTGVDANAFEAAKWFKKAAEAGLADAQLDYGVILFQGKGTPPDQKEGAEMFRRAAEKGNIVAQNRLARCLAQGAGVPANPVAAIKWYLIAKSNGGIDDAELDRTAAKLSKADRLKAEQAAAQWRELVLVR